MCKEPIQQETPMKTAPPDAIVMLKADHHKVQTLCADFEALSDRSKVCKKKLADQICNELRYNWQHCNSA